MHRPLPTSRYALLRALLPVLCLILCLCALPQNTRAAAPYTQTDWMKYLPDCMPITEINMPGTHDSGTTHIFAPEKASCQDMEIPEQLKFGIRFLDIRVGAPTKTPKKAEDLFLYHGSGFTAYVCWKHTTVFGERLNLQDVINWTLDFLKDHPNETVVYMIAAENDKDDNHTPRLIREFIDKHRYSNPNNPDNRIIGFRANDPVPTLGSVRGKIVVFDDPSGTWTQTHTAYENNYHRDKDLGGSVGNKVPLIQRLFRTPVDLNFRIDYTGTIRERWPVFREESYRNEEGKLGNPDVMYSGTNITNVAGDPGHWLGWGPGYCANTLYGYAEISKHLWVPRGFRYGWVAMDFPERAPSITKKLILSNFSQLQNYRAVVKSPENVPITVDMFRLENDGSIDEIRVLETKSEVVDGIRITTVTSEAQPMYDERSHPYEFDVIIRPGVEGNFTITRENRKREKLPYGEDTIGTESILTETFLVVGDQKPLDAEVTVVWESYADVVDRPKSAQAFLDMIGGSLPFEVLDSKGNRTDISVSATVPGKGPYVDSYAISGSESALYIRNLPVMDSYGGRYIYMRINDYELSDYEIWSEKERYKNEYTIHMRYLKPVGEVEVPVNVNWCDGNDVNGLRPAAVNALKKYDFAKDYKAFSDDTKPVFDPILPKVEVKDDGSVITYTLDENMRGTHNINVHVMGAPNLSPYSYRTVNTPTRFRSRMDGSQHTLNSLTTAILQGKCDVSVHWIGTGPRYTGELYVYIGNATAKLDPYSGSASDPNVWVTRNILYDAYDEQGNENRLSLPGKVVVQEVEGYNSTVTATKVPTRIGELPRYEIQVFMTPSEYVGVQGNVIWRDGDLTPRHREVDIEVTQQYLYDIKQEPDPTNIREKKIVNTASRIRWEGDHYSFTDNSLFPTYAGNGSPARYIVDCVDVPYYTKTVNEWDIILTRSVSISGKVDWKDGKRPSLTQPLIHILQNGVTYGDPVYCENFEYNVSGLPVCDENNENYEYTIRIELPFECTAEYLDPQRSPNGNVTQNVILHEDFYALDCQIPIKLDLVNADPATAPESFTFKMTSDFDSPVSIPTQTLVLNRDNGFEGVFTLTSAPEANADMLLVIEQTGRKKLPYWECDKTRYLVPVTVHAINNRLVAEVDLGGAPYLKFTNTFLPKGAILDIGFTHKIINNKPVPAEPPETEFVFELAEVAPDYTETPAGYVSVTGQGEVRFPRLTYPSVGEYHYIIFQRSMNSPGWHLDDNIYPVTVTVTEKDGTLTAVQDHVPTITNVFELPLLDIGVQVQWIDNNRKKVPLPKQLTVELFADGQPVDKALLSKDKGWSCVFKDMPEYQSIARSSASGVRPIVYSLVAEQPTGFTVEVTGDAKRGYVVTCTAIPRIPDTGDSTDPTLLAALLLLSLSGLILLRKREI